MFINPDIDRLGDYSGENYGFRYSFTEGSWTLSNATLMVVGSFKEGASYPSGSRNAVVRNGYLYVPSYDKTGVYKINISNSTVICEK